MLKAARDVLLIGHTLLLLRGCMGGGPLFNALVVRKESLRLFDIVTSAGRSSPPLGSY